LVARFPQDAFERLLIRRFLEQLHAWNAAIQDVKDHPSRSDPRSSWHVRTIANNSLFYGYRTRPAFPLSAQT
jgi:hypothetical protein